MKCEARLPYFTPALLILDDGRRVEDLIKEIPKYVNDEGEWFTVSSVSYICCIKPAARIEGLGDLYASTKPMELKLRVAYIDVYYKQDGWRVDDKVVLEAKTRLEPLNAKLIELLARLLKKWPSADYFIIPPNEVHVKKDGVTTALSVVDGKVSIKGQTQLTWFSGELRELLQI